MDVHALLPLTMTTLGGFLIAALIIAVTPGPDTALTLRNTLVHGSGAGLATAWGSAAGMFAHTFAVVFGVAALLAVSVTAFTVFKVVGALYLFWLGVLAFREAFRRHAPTPQDREATEADKLADKLADIAPSAPAPFVTMLQRWGPARLGASPFAQGVVSAVTNPKMAVFMLTFLPQYLDPAGYVIVQAILLTSIMAMVNIVWLSLYVFALGFVAPVLRRPRVRRFQEGLLGTVFVSFGLRLATASQ